MSGFEISTDNTTDLPKEYFAENEVLCSFLKYTIGGHTYGKSDQLDDSDFYAAMRDGSLPTTAQVNSEELKDLLRPQLEAGRDILHIAFSSGLSGTYNSCMLAASDLREEFPDRTILVVDSLCASMGEGLLVDKAVELRNAGRTIEETCAWLEEHKRNLCHVFTVNDLFHLFRGGRVSRAAAIVGSVISLKPLLHVDDEGHLIPLKNVRGRKKSLQGLVDMMEERVGSWRGKDNRIFISHGGCLEDALYVEELVKKRFGYDSFLVNYIGPTIGAHAGPGTVALFFMGDYR